MTAGKVMSAIKVDMLCRRQQAASMMPASHHIVSGASAAAPSVLDVMRGAAAQRRRGAARVCLFGAPEPGSTRVLYDQMLEQQRQHMLQRYEFDVKTDRFVGDAAVAVQPAGGAVADGASEPIVDQLQQRLQAEDSSELAAAASPSPPSSPTESDDEDNTTDAAAAAAVGSGKVKSTKSTASLRPTKPYDKPAVRPITEFFRKSKKTCPTATAAAATKLLPIRADGSSLSLASAEATAVTASEANDEAASIGAAATSREA